MRTRRIGLYSLAVLFIALAGMGVAAGQRAEPPTTPAAQAWSAPLRQRNNSGLSGRANLTATPDGKTKVEITLANPGPGRLPAHIHVGPCGSLDPRPRHTLTPVEAGRSETTVPVALQALVEGKFSIQVQRTGANDAVACGEIVGG